MRFGRKHGATVGVLLALACITGPALSQEASSPAGHWVGAITVPGGELGIDVDLKVDAGAWSGDISIPMQQTQDFPLSEVAVAGNEVSFLMAGVPGDPTFKGTISEDGLTITGTFTQGGQALGFSLKRTESGGL